MRNQLNIVFSKQKIKSDFAFSKQTIAIYLLKANKKSEKSDFSLFLRAYYRGYFTENTFYKRGSPSSLKTIHLVIRTGSSIQISRFAVLGLDFRIICFILSVYPKISQFSAISLMIIVLSAQTSSWLFSSEIRYNRSLSWLRL